VTYIYGLVCPVSGEIRYIGKSVRPQARFERHIRDAASQATYKDRWLTCLSAQGLRPSLRVICQIPDGVDWKDVERGYIAHGLRSGLRLTNTAAGGESFDWLDPVKYRKFLDKQSERMRANRSDPTWNERLLNAHRSESCLQKRRLTSKAAWEDPAYRAEQSERMKASWNDAESGSRRRSALASKESREKLSQSHKARLATEEGRQAHRARQSAVMASDSVRKKLSDAAKARWADPAKRAAVLAALTSEDALRKKGQKAKALWDDAEYRKKTVNAARQARERRGAPT
jgi:hypothetical protein